MKWTKKLYPEGTRYCFLGPAELSVVREVQRDWSWWVRIRGHVVVYGYRRTEKGARKAAEEALRELVQELVTEIG